MERAMVVTNPKKRKIVISDDDDNDIGIQRREFRFKVLLPNGTSVELKVRSAENEMHFGDFVGLVREKYLETRKKWEWMKKKRDINWKGSGLYLEDAADNKIRNVIEFKNFIPRKCHILRLNDGSSEVAQTFENMWDLTPDTDLLLELPEEYNFEAAIADLIDNALQAVWHNIGKNNRKLVRVNVTDDKISIFDNGSGMDDTDENSLVKWGKMGASIHRLSKSIAIGGKPPYLKPFFGMFGYGGPVASMHLGRRTRVSSKTKQVKKVYMLLLQREALLNRSNSDTWKTNGGIRELTKDEISNSDGSFTKVDIYDPKVKGVDINKLQCRLKDIYFPYIQNDDLSARGKTITPIEFQVNGVDLTEIQGGEVATTNLHSCNGPEFVLQLRMSIKDDHDGARGFHEANARLRFVYFPFREGKESIERVLEKLTSDGYIIRENFQDFSRVSIRRLGRLLPDARWTFLPFMDFRNKRVNSSRGSILRRCSLRVKCFVETDAGFKPTQSKTDLAHHNHFTVALKNLGSKISDKETAAVSVEISTGTKMLTPAQLEKEYQEWIIKMHNQYDEEADATAEDNPVIIVSPPNKKALGISKEVVRVHQILKRKEKSWSNGQRIKVLKGACPGISNNLYATIEYFLLEGFEGDPGGEARIICRPIDIPEEKGCSLYGNEEGPTLNVGRSLSLPITVIDTEKLVAVGSAEWESRLNKIQQKSPVGSAEWENRFNKIQQKSPVGSADWENRLNKIQQKSPVGSAEWENPLNNIQQKSPVCFDTPIPNRYNRQLVGVVDSISTSCDKRVTEKPSLCAEKYELLTDDQSPKLDVRAGSNFPTLEIACYDIHGNRAPFQTTPDVAIQLHAAENLYFELHGIKIGLSTDKMTLKIMDAMVTCNELDKIRPSYTATLIITSKKFPLSLTFPCRVFPSYPKHVTLKPEIRDNQLLPGFIFKELMLEMFDTYRNHVSEGTEVDIVVAGLEMLNHCSTSYKVDDKGKINLNGLLKIIAGYGEIASISVVFQNKSIFKQEFSIARRSLRIASEMPDFCAVGGQLENIEFEIVNVDGEVDTKIHHDDQDCQFHMLTIKSDFFNAEESIRYTFKHGRCTVPSIRVPEIEGTFSFEASHSQYTRLRHDVEVQVIKVSNVKDATQLPDKSIFSPPELTPLNHGYDLISIFNNDDKRLGKILKIGEKINIAEERLQNCLKQKDEIEKDMLMLKNNVQHYQLGYVDSGLTNTKGEMTTKIKSMENSAASVLCSLTTHQKQQNTFLEDIIGVVALLGSVQSPELSRILAEYLGEEKMLGVICKSFNTAISLEKYKQNGEIDFVHALHAEAAGLGKAIRKRFFIMCFENIRPYSSNDRQHNGSWHANDSQRKLFLPDPKMRNGKAPAGFMGYAVNMIDLDTHYLQTRTTKGHGLRETVLFSLFKKLHVYKTRENMVDALPYIEEGAVSLDGGIIRENGTLSLGYGNPCICFPCTNKLDISPEAMEILTQIEGKKQKLVAIEEDIGKLNTSRQKYLQKFKKKQKRYNNIMDNIKIEQL